MRTLDWHPPMAAGSLGRRDEHSIMRDSTKVFTGTVLLSVVLAALRFEEIAGDPAIYRDRMALLFDGEVPYVDFFFEHLPLAIVPMAVPWLLGGAFESTLYTVLFAGLMALCLFSTLRYVERLGDRLNAPQSGMRWLAIAVPLFPIVLFRYDPFPLLLAGIAVVALVEGRERLGVWSTVGGVLVKGWPVVIALPEWWRGRRWRAAGLIGLAVVMFGLMIRLPGFTQARVFTGIHSETFFGGIFTLVRLRSGSSLQLITDAGATYVAVPTWAVVANLSLGAAILGLAIYRSTGGFTWDKGVRLLGAATVAVLVGSPLLSPQFLLWPTLFLAFHPNPMVRRLTVGASALTLIYMLGWNPGFEGDLWWVGVMNLRNLVLLAVGVGAANTVSRRYGSREIGVGLR